ncbi:hypothetical protein GEMRC1_000591 [Eukaryota sp. GEM-RC1]
MSLLSPMIASILLSPSHQPFWTQCSTLFPIVLRSISVPNPKFPCQFGSSDCCPKAKVPWNVLSLHFSTSTNSRSPIHIFASLEVNVRRLYLVAFMLAFKYLEDENYTNSSWSIIGFSHYSTDVLNAMESEMLSLLDWNLFVSTESLQQFLSPFAASITI